MAIARKMMTTATNRIKSRWGNTAGGLHRGHIEFGAEFGGSLAVLSLLNRENTFARNVFDAGAEAVGMSLLGLWPYLAVRGGAGLVGMAAEIGPQMYRAQERQWDSLHRPNVGGNYIDTEQAQTMRQSAVQAIQSSRLNARNALGNEGRMMHRN